jgi:hypothetical protein
VALSNLGNLVPRDEIITIDDLLEAVDLTHDLFDPSADLGVAPGALLELVKITHRANTDNDRVMGYGATLIWGVAIGIHAERRRKDK